MKAILFLALIFSFSIVKGQEFENFKVDRKGQSVINIIPKFDNEPDFEKMEKGVMPLNMDNFSREKLEAKSPDLYCKIAELLDKNQRLFLQFYHNEKGELIYGFFICNQSVLDKLTDEILVKIYKTYKTMKVEVDPNTIKTGKSMVGIINIPFIGK